MGEQEKLLFTSESVTEGHPDKICDQVSDAILDACLEQDKNSRVACECFAGKGFILVGGEITTTAIIDYDEIVRNIIKEIGYNNAGFGFSADEIAVNIMINKQSMEIAFGTNNEINGAGDQGIMFGYACKETPEYMPAPIQFAHNIVKELAYFRKNTELGELFLRPDGKAQVSVEYNENGEVIRIDTIVVSTQHTEECLSETLRGIIEYNIIPKAVPKRLIDENTKVLINPTGKFTIGGPTGDTGLTGRKIIVDSYGGYSRHGGGAWSGKDPTKVDRSASYMARYLAKNIVASGIANKCEIQLAYAIGVSNPVSININTFGTSDVSEKSIVKAIKDNFNLTTSGIIDRLSLKNQTYKELAAYGHVGRYDIETSWEKLDSTDVFKNIY